MGIHEGKRQKPMVLHTSDLPEGPIKEIELCYDQRFYLAVSFEDGVENQTCTSQQAVGVDSGEIHFLPDITAVAVDIKNIETSMEPEIFCLSRSMEKSLIWMFPQNKRIYGSLRRKVVDGLFRPLYPSYLLLT